MRNGLTLIEILVLIATVAIGVILGIGISKPKDMFCKELDKRCEVKNSRVMQASDECLTFALECKDFKAE